MRKVVIALAGGGVVAAAVLAAAIDPQLRSHVWPQVKAADTPAPVQPGIPVTPGTVAAQDVPGIVARSVSFVLSLAPREA